MRSSHQGIVCHEPLQPPFAGIQAASSNPSKTPNTVLLSSDRPGATERRHMKILGVGKYKPMWIVDLHYFPIASSRRRRGLEPFIGKLSIDAAGLIFSE